MTWPARGTHFDEVDVLGSTMAYVRGGAGPTILFTHGNPTSSFLWRHVIAELARYMDAFVDELGLRDVVYVGHDWGAVLGLDLARRRPDVISRIALCEGHLHSFDAWSDMDEGSAELFSRLRQPGIGEQLVLEENFFIEHVLPGGMSRTLTAGEWHVYRAPFLEQRHRLPILRWIQQIPVAGEPPVVEEIVRANEEVLLTGRQPRLLLHGTPGAVVGPNEVDSCRREARGLDIVDVGEGTHFLPEDQPRSIAAALRLWAGI